MWIRSSTVFWARGDMDSWRGTHGFLACHACVAEWRSTNRGARLLLGFRESQAVTKKPKKSWAHAFFFHSLQAPFALFGVSYVSISAMLSWPLPTDFLSNARIFSSSLSVKKVEMRIVFLLTTLFLAVSADGDVLAYTDSNFDELIKSHEVSLVKFYAPW
ncbi:unnamed protein product [Strongylus vulgaris]|uniref:Thioredoxin domain-containing protein n=1 Tax=Strongylus vulgaris TaxID=40348 RepID=A0A3P7I5G6_STRVU|nr:unnamed protein product [Strongylus vulgaris]